MNVLELFGMAMRTVISNPLRTILTMLGVIIGVASVITLVAIGQGTAAQIEKQYEGLGTNLIVVNLLGNGRAQQLDYNELMQIENLPEFAAFAPTINKSGANVKYDRTKKTYTVIGTNDRYLDVMKAEMETGRFITEADVENRSQVAIVGSTVAEELFGSLNPVGEEINIDGFVYTIVGKTKTKGSNSTGSSVDNSIFLPLVSAQRDFKLGSIRTLNIEAADKNNIAAAQSTIEAYLTNKFKSSDGYRVVNQDELMNARKEASTSLTNQLISVACISLLVGGIGIMNIMMVTVSERTREIGIRKSIGAKRRNILIQFLVEASVISGLGGLIGLLGGVALAIAWPHFNPSQTTKISMDVGLYAFLFSVLVGVIFGLYPANKASKLRPIDALRTD
ncbi:ABC transporter permease [Paenibacillus contaminans]|uniref:Macrolide ABC transporter ATP-binding protein n=1 Tax=Paenibacillus contaminans TaxID=450362 RepID=A0A329LVA2_9BACL|nr:ABC transporter permease [Paenibacillus contaminans]RAV10483.1 macrolide ABC transporter ATP-binding protein [Paenibacillus contaminans]